MYGRPFLQRMYGDIYIFSHISVVNDPIQTKNYTFITSHIKKRFTEFQSKRWNIGAVRINYLILFILYLVCVIIYLLLLLLLLIMFFTIFVVVVIFLFLIFIWLFIYLFFLFLFLFLSYILFLFLFIFIFYSIYSGTPI